MKKCFYAVFCFLWVAVLSLGASLSHPLRLSRAQAEQVQTLNFIEMMQFGLKAEDTRIQPPINFNDLSQKIQERAKLYRIHPPSSINDLRYDDALFNRMSGTPRPISLNDSRVETLDRKALVAQGSVWRRQLQRLLDYVESTLMGDYLLLKNNEDKIDEARSWFWPKHRVYAASRRNYWKGFTLAHLAALKNDDEALKSIAILTKHDNYEHSILNKTNDYDQKPIDLAIHKGSVQAFQMLVHLQRKLPGQYARLYNRYAVDKLRRQSVELLETLDALEAQYHQDNAKDSRSKADVEHGSERKQLMYDIAQQRVPSELREQDFFRAGDLKMTPLTLALEVGNMKAATALLQAGHPVLPQDMDTLIRHGLRLSSMVQYIHKHVIMGRVAKAVLQKELMPKIEARLAEQVEALGLECSALLTQ